MVINEASPPAEATEQFAQKVFCELQQSILQHEANAIAGEIEAVHDMRVGIRRFRVALGNFRVCLLKEDRERLRTNLEHLADALGGVRDLDVMMSALRSKLASRPSADRTAINSFIRRLRDRRRRRHRQLVNYLQGQQYASLKREFQTIGKSETEHRRGIEELQNEQAT